MKSGAFLLTNSGHLKAVEMRTFVICVCILSAGVDAIFSQENQKMASDFEAKTTTGRTISLSQYRGQVILLDFWASWCGPCREEFPFLLELYRDNMKKDFVLLAINLDEDPEKIGTFLERIHAHVNFPVITDPKGQIPTLFEIDRMPTTILIDKRGEIRYKHSGFQNSLKGKLAGEIQTLLVDRPEEPQ